MNKRAMRVASHATIITIILIAEPPASTAKNSKPAAAPPSMTKLPDVPVFAALPDGRMIGVSMGSTTSGQAMMARYSSDGGRTWSESKETLCPLPKELGSWGLHNVLADHDGELHLFLTTDGNIVAKGLYDTHFDIYHVGSENGRTKWKAPVSVSKGYYGSMQSAIELKSGRIILPICYLTPRVWSNRGKGFDAFTDMGRFSSGVLYSDDGGDTWKQSDIELKVPSPYIGADGMIEPIALELKDGRVWLLIRTQLGRFFESFSQDGSVWTRPQPTSIRSSDSPPSLTRLKDGRIVMLWNNSQRYAYAQGGRHILHAAVSEDDGRTWRGYREVARNPFVDEPPPPNGDHGVAYPLPATTPDGEIIVPLSVGGTGGMWLLRLDPEYLYEVSRKTDFSDGIEAWHSFGTKGVELVPSPDKPGANALHVHKAAADWPAVAVWNFPNGMNGSLRMRVKLNPGFAGARIGLTDHFSVPFDPEDRYFNLFNFTIGPDGSLGQGDEMKPEQWHMLQFDWDCAKEECRVSVDGRSVELLHMQRQTEGINYVRICSTAEDTDNAGLLIESVESEPFPN
jgi:hypothetical protein